MWFSRVVPDVAELLAEVTQATLAGEPVGSALELQRAKRRATALISAVALHSALAQRGHVQPTKEPSSATKAIEDLLGPCWLTRLASEAEAIELVGRWAPALEDWAGTVGRVGDLYDHLARVEMSWVADHLEVSGASGHRMGSAYYTPHDLAMEACRLMPLSPSTRVADLSCGTGAFLLAALSDVRDPHALHGVDVDALALDVARLEIAVASGDPRIAMSLSSNFSVGNPLLPASAAATEERARLFDDGFIYDLRQGVETPDVDVIVGNPPWQRVRLDERSFFRMTAPDVAALTSKRERSRAIAELEVVAPSIFHHYCVQAQTIEDARREISNDQRFAVTSSGELNTYSLFAELACRLTDHVGLLVKSALFTTKANARFLHWLTAQKRLSGVFDFVNSGRVFDIDSRERFSLMITGPVGEAAQLRFAAGLRRPDDLRSCSSRLMTQDDLWSLNPVTGVLPNSSEGGDLDLLAEIALISPRFDDEFPEARFGRLVHLTAHADHIHREPGPRRIGVLEGKFIEQYDGRFSTFEGVEAAARYRSKARARRPSEDEVRDAAFAPTPRFYVDETTWTKLTRGHTAAWSLMWRNTTSATNRRTVLATVLPHQPTTQSIQLLQLGDGRERELGLLLASFNSIVFDFLVRQRLNGIDVTSTVIRQTSVPSLKRFTAVQFNPEVGAPTLADFVLARVAALLSNDARLSEFVALIGGNGELDLVGRRRLRNELDAAIGLAYGLELASLDRILRHFQRDVSERDRAEVLECWSALNR